MKLPNSLNSRPIFHIFSAQRIKTLIKLQPTMMNYHPAALRYPVLLLQTYKHLLIQLCSQFDHKHQDCRRCPGHSGTGFETIVRTELSFHFKLYATPCFPPAIHDSVFISPLGSCPSGLETAQIPVRPMFITIGFKRLGRWDFSDLAGSHSLSSGQPVLIGCIEDFQSIQVTHTHTHTSEQDHSF